LDADERTRWASRLIGWRPGARGGVATPPAAEGSPVDPTADGAAAVERTPERP
jgi:hypothetical protein